jgi:hypothetical protein
VPTLHLVIVVSSYVDDACPDASEVGAELQHLVDAIVPIIKPSDPLNQARRASRCTRCNAGYGRSCGDHTFDDRAGVGGAIAGIPWTFRVTRDWGQSLLGFGQMATWVASAVIRSSGDTATVEPGLSTILLVDVGI